MDKVKIFAYNTASKGAQGIRKGLGIKQIKPEGSAFKGGKKYTVINWGASEVPESVQKSVVWNTPAAVSHAANKLLFFQKMAMSLDPPRMPDWTGDTNQALRWVEDGKVVVARTKLNAHSGDGIVFFNDVNEFVKAKLYTVYVPKKEEYRVHVFKGEVIDTQRKVLRKEDDLGQPIDPALIDFRVRSHKNGFVFQRDNIHPDEDVINQAMKAYNASDLDFGAVDVIYNQKKGSAYVLEINTSPGLEGQTLEKYLAAFRKELE